MSVGYLLKNINETRIFCYDDIEYRTTQSKNNKKQQNSDNNPSTYSESVQRSTNQVTDMSVYRTVEGIEHAHYQTQREKMAPSPLPVSRSQASKTHISSLVTKDLADLQLTLAGPSAHYKFNPLIDIYNGGYSCHYVEQSLRLSLLVTTIQPRFTYYTVHSIRPTVDKHGINRPVPVDELIMLQP